MQASKTLKLVPVDEDRSNEVSEADRPLENGNILDEEPAHDVSGKNWELSLLDSSENSVKGLYVYKNVFNLIPRSIRGFEGLKTLKFFGNEINLFPSETGNLVELECLQVKISSPGLSSLPLQKLKALKELELCKVPPRHSAFPLLSEIAHLKSLTKLTVCHFSIRYLPPEIGCLNKLEDLELSFNKLKRLPKEITALSSLKSLKVANNKLEELPPDLFCLQRLETLDLSNNKLTSLGSLELASMQTLRKLNLQYNKLLNCCQIPSWICCNLEGNGKDTCNDDFISSSIEVDVLEATIRKFDGRHSCNGSHGMSSVLSEASSNSRCSTARRRGKGWKRRDYLQQRARQERLNSIRKWRNDDNQQIMTMKVDAKCKECKLSAVPSESMSEPSSVVESASVFVEDLDDNYERTLADKDHLDIKCKLPADASESMCESSSVVESASVFVKDIDDNDERALAGEDYPQILGNNSEDENIIVDSIGKECECDHSGETSAASSCNNTGVQDEDSASEASRNTPKSKRHSDRDLDNPKPSKSRRPVDDCSNLSWKYSTESFCSIKDRLPDGFYDAGRDRPFSSLQSYEHSVCLDSREVILVDRKRDEELDVITLSAQALVSPLKQPSSLIKEGGQLVVNNLQRASLLALFVSNWFGGSDRSNLITTTRKSVAGVNYQKPFVCTCSTGNSENATSYKRILSAAENFNFIDLCENSLRIIKRARNSSVVPIGTLRWGVCRHRAVLMKYLCDRVDPPIPCELVRGYLDFMPHAWNTILVRRDDSWVRMVVDACCPTDIREETDPEFFCRYMPLRRLEYSLTSENLASPDCSFPSLSFCDEVNRAASSSLVRCKFGSVQAVAKVRTLKTYGATVEEIKNFEYTCLGEVRILGALKKHSCIVDIYGHQISSQWVPSVDGNEEHRLLRSAIVMEYIEGGSLRSYLEKLSKTGESRVPVEMALSIARDVACALVELHSKHIIHRDIKSENILIDLDRTTADGNPLVKLCDFDRAVPLRSFSHTCCIAHVGIPPPNVCVGTPRWMAPEVLQAMHRRNMYGLEVDIWSYGCLLLELLTLKIPYAGLSESNIHDLLQMGRRPQLTDELEVLTSSEEEPEMERSRTEVEGMKAEEEETLRLLVDLFQQCTEVNPEDRPTARDIYETLQAQSISFAS
ncbi:Protein kinase domain [Macleaya cordata]|uniref:Protein kinase domain n=1 Tax=Macleaya cordata TaxID=56857 RepID=A0A200PZ37_MACCD|nr:Protein kinase domain [Macleaya cordata]